MDQAEIPAASTDLAAFSTSTCVELISLAWQILRLVSAAATALTVRMVGITVRTTAAMKRRHSQRRRNHFAAVTKDRRVTAARTGSCRLGTLPQLKPWFHVKIKLF